MTIRQFIRQHRKSLDSAIRRYLDRPHLRLNDAERERWILNDEGLYHWARSSGVRSI